MTILKCPVCGGSLNAEPRRLVCSNRHSFDIAKEGYVNLLLSGKSGDLKGDNKEMARSRRDFLNRGYFEPLANAVRECAAAYSAGGDAVLDICCGEGYYTQKLSEGLDRRLYGFDISKNMVRLAAKRRCGATFFVANIASVPVRDESVRFAAHLFAPFHAGEFSRILETDGVIATVIPGRDHLMGLKNVLYSEPYPNDEKAPDAPELRLTDTVRVRGTITLPSREDIASLFQMTPYYYHTPSAGMKRMQQLDSLTTDIEFVILLYRK